MMIAI